MQESQTSSTPNQEPERLAAALAENVKLSTEVVKLGADNAELRNEIKWLREKLDKLARRIFGTKSEQIDSAQLLLLLAGLDPKAEEPVEAAVPQPSAQASVPRRNKKREPRTPDNLRIIEERIVPERVAR